MNLREKVDITIKYPESVFTGDRTYSSLFLPPVFGIMFDSTLSKMLVNTYLNDKHLNHNYNRPLFLLLKVRDIDYRYNEVNLDLIKNPNFVYKYCVGTNKGYILYMYVFESPKEFEQDYDNFIKGKYSQFSPKLKSKFARVVPDLTGKYVESPLYGAIYKTPTLKKSIENILFEPGEKLDPSQEYFGKPDINIETF